MNESSKPAQKKFWPTEEFPRDAKPVDGIKHHESYTYKHPRFGTQYICKVEFGEIPLIDRIKCELESELGEELRTGNVKFKKDGVESWWFRLPLALLRRMDCWVPPAAEISQPIVAPEPTPKTHEVKIQEIDKITSSIDKIGAVIEEQLKLVSDGNYIPMNKTQPELRMSLLVQRKALAILKGQFAEALNVCRDEV